MADTLSQIQRIGRPIVSSQKVGAAVAGLLTEPPPGTVRDRPEQELPQIIEGIRPIWRKSIQVLGLCLMIALLYARAHVVLQSPTFAIGFNTFGYLRAEQRAAFDVLASLTPSEAIVATSLNSGPIELYANRDAVRPAYWSQDEWLDFVARARDDGRKVYLLVDGVEMSDPFQVVQSRYRLTLVSYLPVPYFYPGGNSHNLSVPLYEVVN